MLMSKLYQTAPHATRNQPPAYSNHRRNNIHLRQLLDRQLPHTLRRSLSNNLAHHRLIIPRNPLAINNSVLLMTHTGN